MNQEKDGNELVFFYDIYALYAIAVGKEGYAKFSKECKIITTLMNLYELYYSLIKEKQEELAEEFFNRLLSSCAKITPEIIKEASRFRLEHIKKELSYIDSLGYCIAKSLGIKFLTGDKEFENLPNVKFIKE